MDGISPKSMWGTGGAYPARPVLRTSLWRELRFLGVILMNLRCRGIVGVTTVDFLAADHESAARSLSPFDFLVIQSKSLASNKTEIIQVE